MKRHNVRCSCGKEVQGVPTGEYRNCPKCGRGFRVVGNFVTKTYSILADRIEPVAPMDYTVRRDVVIISSYESQA